MQYRKFVLGLLAICIVSTMPLNVHAEDTRVSIDGGNGSWHGGVNDSGTIVYSKIWDHTVDKRAYSATVWVKNALGSGKEKTGTTYGVNKQGEVKITCKAEFSPFAKNKAGYKDLSIVNLEARQARLRDTTAPSSFEVEFEVTNPAEKD